MRSSRISLRAVLEATKCEVAEKFNIQIESAESLANEVEQGEKAIEGKQELQAVSGVSAATGGRAVSE